MINNSAADGRIAVRESHIELLRIIIMICVVANHFVSHSGLTVADSSINANFLWIQLLKLCGKIIVDILCLFPAIFQLRLRKKLQPKPRECGFSFLHIRQEFLPYSVWQVFSLSVLRK